MEQEMQKQQKYQYKFPIGILGNSGVGKTSIYCQFTEKKFHPYLQPTLGVLNYKKIIDHPNKGKICLDLKDTAGQEKLNSITFTYLKGVQALIFVYDVTDRKSYLNLETEINRILDNIVQPDTPIVIVGNKYDVDKKNHMVKEEEGQNLAQSYKCSHFFASAKDNYNIDQIFEYLVDTIDLEKLSCYNLSISQNPKLKNQQSNEKLDYDRKICGCI